MMFTKRQTAGSCFITMLEKNGCDWRLHALNNRVVLVVLWLLGYVSAYTMGGFIHILLVLAIVVVLIRLIQGRRLLS